MGAMSTYKKITNIVLKRYNNFLLKRKNADFSNDLIINGKLYIYDSGSFRIGKNVIINSGKHYNQIGGDTRTILHALNGAEISIGEGCRISNSAIYAKTKIKIGKNVYIGANCKIYDSDYHSLILEERISSPDLGIISKPVQIKDGAFIGAHTIILKGVTIGERAIIGAGSVVTKCVPDGEIWAGNPAKYVRNIERS